MHRLGTKPERAVCQMWWDWKIKCYQIAFGCFGFKSPYIAFITRILKINSQGWAFEAVFNHLTSLRASPM